MFRAAIAQRDQLLHGLDELTAAVGTTNLFFVSNPVARIDGLEVAGAFAE